MFLLREIADLYNAFANKVYEANILDKKTKELISISCSIMADCTPCINHHYKKAIEAGATKDEISEAIAISMSVSAGSKKSKYTSVITELEKNN